MKHLLPSLGLALFFCSTSGIALEIPKDQAVERAEEAAHRFHKMMKSHVKSRFKESGMISAARFCAEESHREIEKLNRELGPDISLKRISLENRNPDAYPLDSEADIIRAFELMESSNAYLPEQIVQMIDETTYKVYLPATMSSKNCKKCHGKEEEMDPEVRKYVQEHYPKDRATGFRSGQVRGAVVVTVRIHDNNQPQ
jgi:hypothetical protein